MIGKEHAKLFYGLMLFFIPMFILLKWYDYLLLLCISYLLIDADKDTAIHEGKFHRWFITHSFILPIIVILAFWIPLRNITIDGSLIITRIGATLCIPQIVHLLADIPTTDCSGSKYRVHFWKGKLLSGKASRWWYITNALLMIIGITLLDFYL